MTDETKDGGTPPPATKEAEKRPSVTINFLPEHHRMIQDAAKKLDTSAADLLRSALELALEEPDTLIEAYFAAQQRQLDARKAALLGQKTGG